MSRVVTCYLLVQLGPSGPGGLDILAAGCCSEEDPTLGLGRGDWVFCPLRATGPTYEDAEESLFAELVAQVHYRAIPAWAGTKILHLLRDNGRGSERELARGALDRLVVLPLPPRA